MAKGTTTDFSEKNTESAMQVMDWMRDMTEQSLNQSKSALEGFFTTARKASEDIDEQASELRKRSLFLAQGRSLRNKAKSWGRPRREELRRSEGRLIRGWRKHLEEGPKPLNGKSW
jgi:hypothetical protein